MPCRAGLSALTPHRHATCLMTELLHSSPTAQQLTAPLQDERVHVTPLLRLHHHRHTISHFCELAWISEFLLQLGGSLKTPDVRMTPNKAWG